MSHNNPNPKPNSNSNSVDKAQDQQVDQIKKELDEKTVDTQDLIYNQRIPENPREAVHNPSVVPETFSDSRALRSDLRHDDEE
ncbi:MAG: hypothetical protein ACTS2F_01820 [Thainema sp.]